MKKSKLNGGHSPISQTVRTRILENMGIGLENLDQTIKQLTELYTKRNTHVSAMSANKSCKRTLERLFDSPNSLFRTSTVSMLEELAGAAEFTPNPVENVSSEPVDNDSPEQTSDDNESVDGCFRIRFVDGHGEHELISFCNGNKDAAQLVVGRLIESFLDLVEAQKDRRCDLSIKAVPRPTQPGIFDVWSQGKVHVALSQKTLVAFTEFLVTRGRSLDDAFFYGSRAMALAIAASTA